MSQARSSGRKPEFFWFDFQFAADEINCCFKTHASFRFFNVYGPGQRAGHVYAAVIPVFIDKALRGEVLPINGDGLTSRDFTFVDTVCATLLDACRRQVTHPEPVNLAFGTNTSLNELVAELARLLGRDLDVE